MSKRVKQGDPAPTGRCVWKKLADGTYAIKVTYVNDDNEPLYAVFASDKGVLRATGEHLTLAQVLSRGN